MENVILRGVHFTAAPMEETCDAILDRVKSGDSVAVFTPNSEIVQLCIDNPENYEIINSAEFCVPDGIGVIKAAKILKLPIKERVPGIELGERVLSLADSSLPVYFMGGKPGVAEEAAKRMCEKYPELTVCGTHDGYFQKTGEENDAVIKVINDSGAAVLFALLLVFVPFVNTAVGLDSVNVLMPVIALVITLVSQIPSEIMKHSAK